MAKNHFTYLIDRYFELRELYKNATENAENANCDNDKEMQRTWSKLADRWWHEANVIEGIITDLYHNCNPYDMWLDHTFND